MELRLQPRVQPTYSQVSSPQAFETGLPPFRCMKVTLGHASYDCPKR